MDSAVYVLALVLAITMVIAALSNQIKKNKVIQERFRFNQRRFSPPRNQVEKHANSFRQNFSDRRDDVRRPSKGFLTGIFNDINNDSKDISRGPSGPSQDELRRIDLLKQQQEEREREEREHEREQMKRDMEQRERDMKRHQELLDKCMYKSTLVRDKMRILQNNLEALNNERPVFNTDGRHRVQNKLGDALLTMNELSSILNDVQECASIEAPMTTQPVTHDATMYK